MRGGSSAGSGWRFTDVARHAVRLRSNGVGSEVGGEVDGADVPQPASARHVAATNARNLIV
jgi:hypothetical protein